MSCIITYNGQNFTQEDFLDYLKSQIPTSINNPSDFTNHSGGAKGYDAEWDIIGSEYGMVNNKHYLLPEDGEVSDLRLRGKGVKPVDATNDIGHVAKTGPVKGEAQLAVSQAERLMGRIESTHFTRNTKKIRNYAQVKNADGIFAIGSLIPKGSEITIARGQATKTALIPQVNGGTSVAVQLSIMQGKPTYVFNQVGNSVYSQGWYKWDNTVKDFVSTETPTLTKNFAGIGTSSNTTEAGKQAIRDVYEKTFNQSEQGSKQDVEGFKNWVDSNQSNIQYQLPQNRELEEFVASEKTIRDLAARMSNRIGIPVRFESDRTKKYKGKIENGTAYINLAYATLDTPIHEILGHPIIRAIKNKELYQNLLKELETGKGKEVLDRIKKDYQFKEKHLGTYSTPDQHGYYADSTKYFSKPGYYQSGKPSGSFEIYEKIPYTLEEQQEEAIVELLGLMTAEKLDNAKDGKLISLLKRLLKEMKQFVRSLINQKEVEIDKLPDNMTLGDIADLLAYSNSRLILPGNEVIYTTPDNQQFKTYQEASNHISELARNVEDVDLSNVKINNKSINDLTINDVPKSGFEGETEDSYYKYENNEWIVETTFDGYFKRTATEEEVLKSYIKNTKHSFIKDFIEKNKEYEQSKEIIEEWKKVNNIQYNPEEIYSRGQEFSSVVGAYSEFDVNLMMQNLLSHIEDNEKAGGKFAISAYTKPIDKQIGHLEGGGGKIKFKLYPQSNDILWAANTDVYSGSVWDASEKVNKDKKSELLGVSYTKYPSLSNVNTVQPNLASIVDDLNHHHNELGIVLTGNNFRLEYDEDIPYTTKKVIDGINKILDQKYGKLVKPEIKTKKLTFEESKELKNLQELNEQSTHLPEHLDKEDLFTKENQQRLNELSSLKGIQPTQTNKTLKESIESVKYKVGIYGGKRVFNTYTELNKGSIVTVEGQIGEYYIESVSESNGEIGVGITNLFYDLYPINEFDPETNPNGQHPLFNVPEKAIKQKEDKEKEYTEQALINTKIAALKEVAKKYPRSLIRSEVRSINSSSNLGFTKDELPFQKVSSNSSQQVQQDFNTPTDIDNFAEEAFECK